MTGRVVARFIVVGAAVTCMLATVVSQADLRGPDPSGPPPTALGARGALEAAFAGSGGHVDPLPPGVELSDPVDTSSLYARAGLTRTGATTALRTDAASAVPPGDPATHGLTRHVTPSCTGSGTDGNRVQVLYVRERSTPSRYGDVLPLIRNEIANVDDVFAVSARKTGGDLRVRWVHHGCLTVVEEVQLPDGTLDDTGQPIELMESVLADRGYDDPHRKYLAFADARLICGIASYWLDDRASENFNDGYASAYSRVDAPCWSGSESTPAHELLHNLGGVQASAPNATPYGHCSDEADLMCYDDGSHIPMRDVCGTGGRQLLDCRDNDYFSTNPASGSYLATHWNTAASSFLDAVGTEPGAPVTPQPPRVATHVWARWKGRTDTVVGHLATTGGDRVAGERVVLQKRARSGRWVKVTGRRTDRHGRVAAHRHVRRPAYFRWVFHGGPELRADRSGRVRAHR